MVQISVKRMLRTRGALVAAVTALAVGLTLVAGQALVIACNWLTALPGLHCHRGGRSSD